VIADRFWQHHPSAFVNPKRHTIHYAICQCRWRRAVEAPLCP
jgi:hypothetical protein